MNEEKQRADAAFSGPLILNQPHNFEELLKDIFDLTLKVFKADAGLIRIYEEDTRELVVKAHKGILLEKLRKTLRRKYGEGRAWKCVLSGQPIIDRLEEVSQDYFEKPFGFSVLVPLQSKNRLIGCISLFSHTQSRFHEENLELFSYIGNQIGVALDNARLFNQVEQRTQSLTTLYAISQTVNQSLDIDQILSDALDKVLEALKADAGLFRLLDEETRELVLRMHKGYSAEEIKHAVVRRKFGEGSAWRCVLQGRPESRIRTDQDVSSFRKKTGLHTSANIPLTSKNRAMGIMAIDRRSPREFSLSDMELFSNIGNMIGIAIDNARLFNQTEERSKSLTSLYTISQTVNQSLDLEVVLNNALDKIMELFNCDSTIIRILDEKTQELVFAAQKGLTPEELGTFAKRRKLHEGLGSLPIISGKVEVIQDVPTDPRSAGSQGFAMQIGSRSLAMLPLYAKDKLLGNLSIHNRKPHAFTEQEIQLFTSIGHLLGTAIENSMLYQDKEFTIKELREMQEKLYQSQKMEAIGTLAGGIAHDFNNILSVITGYGYLVLTKMSKEDPQRLSIERILGAADRGANLTQGLLAFSRKNVMDKKPVNLNGIIENVEKLLLRVMGEDIELKTILYSPATPSVKNGLREITILADSGQIEQVLVNLAANARDAMPKGGVLTIETSLTEIDNGFVMAHGYGTIGKYAMISVTGTGIGMDNETRKRVFEPFFTTKDVGKGTGLGLSIVYGIIKQHNGYINIYSEPGNDTIFRIYLPVTSRKGEGKKIYYDEKVSGKGTGTILLAEDDDSVRALERSLLEESGYTIIEAVDGEDAVRKFKENKELINLLLFDLVMPKMTGKEAYEEITKIDPNVAVLFMSGYSDDVIRQRGILKDRLKFIPKPVSAKDLLKKVKDVLEQKK